MTNENDRELLELAALAAGYDAMEGYGIMGPTFLAVDGKHWDPLADDGDALRLAATLMMNFRCDAEDREYFVSCYAMGKFGHACPGELMEMFVPFEEGELGSTIPYRRAAVALAARLGKTTTKKEKNYA